VQATQFIQWNCWTDIICGAAMGDKSSLSVNVGAGQKICVKVPDGCKSSRFPGPVGLGGCSVKGFVNIGKTCDVGGQGTIAAGCNRTGFTSAWEISCP
ncbi:hypothetical protein FS749_009052, partial [Ceratobasidium sp. UAMH 11750]